MRSPVSGKLAICLLAGFAGVACGTLPTPAPTPLPVTTPAPANAATSAPPPSVTPHTVVTTSPPSVTPYTAVATPEASVVAAARKVRVAHDYNGDGYPDLVVGAPQPTADGNALILRAEVVYGSADGLTTTKREIVSTGVVAPRTEDDILSIASGDFDRDGYADLAIVVPITHDPTAPQELRTNHQLTIVFGTADGLSGTPVTVTQPPAAGWLTTLTAAGDFNKDGYQDLVVTNDAGVWVTDGGRGIRKGRASWKPVLSKAAYVGSLASGDVTGDGFADLAVAYSAEDAAEEGTGVVYRGSPTGLAGRVPGRFPGSGVGAVAIGDIDGDGYGDVIAGNSYADAEDSEGLIYISRGSAGGLAERRSLGPGSPGMPRTAHAAGGFGSSVAVGDVDADGYGDVAVGSDGDTGAVYILRGRRGGLSARDARVIVPETVGVSGPDTTGFGQTVSLIDLDGDTAAELLAAAHGAVFVYSPTGRNAPARITPEQRNDDFGYPLN